MSTEKHPDETWDGWTARLASDLPELAGAGWITLAVHVESHAAQAGAAAAAGAAGGEAGPGSRANRTPRTWRRLLGRGSAAVPAPAPEVPEAFLQARQLEGVIALECIADTEFEGWSDLTDEQVDQLVALGWERDGDEPDLTRTFEPAAAVEAAELLAATLREVLGAGSPTDVDLRRSPA